MDVRSAMHGNAVYALRRGSQIGPRCTRAEVGPWLLIDADSEQSFLNVAVPLTRLTAPARAIDQAHDWFSARDRRFCFLLREDADAPAVELLRARGRRIDHRLPALVMSPLLAAAPAPDGLEVTEVRDRDELAVYAGIGGEEQGLSPTLMRAIAETAYQTDGFTLLVGRRAGVPVATSLALVTGDTVGIYNVNVTLSARRRGLGTAMTWAAIERGRRAGCVRAFLESTPMSHRLYQRMGFQTRYSYVQIGT
jgi:GNAT superfamily N-acetyltransferase